MNFTRAGRLAAVAAAIVALAIAGGDAVSFARPLPPAATVGLGKTSCREWLAARKRRDAAATTLEQWVLGYLSGYNAFAPGPKDLFTDYDSTNLLAWVDQRCTANAPSTVSAVLYDFVQQLAKSRAH